ncbi:MAG: hypothetical protein ACR2HG_15925 [Pyrinomonadaceae bacterium]
MSLNDFLIVYLACGAPFGVYYFTHQRAANSSIRLASKALLVFIFWLPFAVIVICRSKIFIKNIHSNLAKLSASESEIKRDIFLVQKEIEKSLPEESSAVSLFELRETIERYIGLTLAVQTETAESAEQEQELFRISGREKTKLAAICLKRRNQKRLAFHQIAARRDFTQLIERLLDSGSEQKKLERFSIKLAKILNDCAARNNLQEMFAARLQTGDLQSVEQMEKDLWKPEIHKPSPVQSISTRLQTMTATANSRGKD